MNDLLMMGLWLGFALASLALIGVLGWLAGKDGR